MIHECYPSDRCVVPQMVIEQKTCLEPKPMATAAAIARVENEDVGRGGATRNEAVVVAATAVVAAGPGDPGFPFKDC